LFFSAGGLVTAVAPVVINGNGVWVGWPGVHMDNPNEPIPESDPNDRTPTAGLLSRKVRKKIVLRFVYATITMIFRITNRNNYNQ
jgi:trehalose-6-phosphate synthase